VCGDSLDGWVQLADGRQHIRVAHDGLGAPLVGVEGHELDEAHGEGVVLGQCDEIAKLVIVDVSHHDAVQLGVEPALQRLTDALAHAVEPVASSDDGEPGGMQGVKGDVEGCDSHVTQYHQLAGETESICCDPQLPHSGDGTEAATEVLNVRVDEGFPAADADLGNPEGHKQAREPQCLLRGEKLRRRRELYPICRHTVLATKVAAFCNRNAEVRVIPTKRVQKP